MRKYQLGFTLIELMITVAIAAIVLAIAVPSFNTQILNNRSVALSEDLVNAINYARSEAVKRGSRISICASNTGTTCAGTWNDGWMVFVDAAAADNAALGVVATGGVLRYWTDLDNGASITVSDNKTLIRFTGLGILGRVDGNQVVITSKISGCKNDSARRIEVGLAGGVTVTRAGCQ